MAVDMKEVATKMQEGFSELRCAVAAQKKEIDDYGKARAETQQKVDKIIAEVIAQNEAFAKRADATEAALKRLGLPGDAREGRVQRSERSKLFWKSLRKDPKSLTPEEFKQLSTCEWKMEDPETGEEKAVMLAGFDQTGGYVCPPELITEILRAVTVLSPIRELSNVRTTTNRSVMQIKNKTAITGGWVGEQTAAPTAQAGKLVSEEIHAHGLKAIVHISKEDLADAVINLEAIMRDEVSLSFATDEGAAFVSGATTVKPEGIAKNAEVRAARTLTTGGSNVIALADLYSIAFGLGAVEGLKEAYARSATWLFRRIVIGKILQFTVGTAANQFVWQPALANGTPATILGIPWRECADLDADGATLKNVGLLGDFRRGYTVVDRISMTVETDPYTVENFVKFTFYKRVGGSVVMPEAIKLLTTPDA